MGWVVAVLVALGAGAFYFLKDDEDEATPSQSQSESTALETQMQDAADRELINMGWGSSLYGLAGDDVVASGSSSFTWRGWGVVVTELYPGDYQLNINYNNNPPRNETASRIIHSGPLSPMTNCANPYWCEEMNALFVAVKRGIASGEIVPNKA